MSNTINTWIPLKNPIVANNYGDSTFFTKNYIESAQTSGTYSFTQVAQDTFIRFTTPLDTAGLNIIISNPTVSNVDNTINETLKYCSTFNMTFLGNLSDVSTVNLGTGFASSITTYSIPAGNKLLLNGVYDGTKYITYGTIDTPNFNRGITGATGATGPAAVTVGFTGTFSAGTALAPKLVTVTNGLIISVA